MAHIDLDIRMGLSETLQAFRSRNDAHEFNMLSAMLLDEVNGCHSRAAGGQHGICYYNGTLLDGIRQLTEIFVGPGSR